MSRGTWVLLVLICAVFLVGMLVENRFIKKSENKTLAQLAPQITQQNLISPLADRNSGTQIEGSVDIKQQVAAMLATLPKDQVEDVSVYFHDLVSGSWFGINENNQYAPGSLLKIPIMIAYLKLAEQHPELLAKKIVYTYARDENALQLFKPSRALEINSAYAVDDLIYQMIVYSGNNSKNLLLDNINEQALLAIFSDLGISIPPENIEDFVTARSFSNIFERLYSVTYLNKTMSEKALTLMAKSEYSEGLVAGVPSDIITAHKYGEFLSPLRGNSADSEFHDCGIVYYPNEPYILCVMTRGHDWQAQQATIRLVSKIVYQKVDATKNQ